MALTQVPLNMLDPAAGSLMFRNRVINGDMRIDQRNGGASISSGVGALVYPCDRIFVYATGAAFTAQRTGTAGAYSLVMTGAASNTFAIFGQRIEAQNIADLAGGAITISVTLSASSAQTIQWAATVPTATDNYASTGQIATGTFSVTTTPTTFTATIPAASTSTVVRGLQVQFAANNGGAFTSGTITASNLQIEAGSNATPFERRPYGMELALCQRYYQTISDHLCGGHAVSGSVTIYNDFPLPVSMRTTPTGTVVGTVTYTNASAYAINSTTGNKCRISINSVTSGYAYGFGAALTFNAEL